MTVHEVQTASVGEGASRYLAALPQEKREASRQEVWEFVLWCGRDRPFAGLAPHEVATYAERLSASVPNCQQRIEYLRAFLAHARKVGWRPDNLAVHLKVKRKGAASSAGDGNRESISLTQEGHDELKCELDSLKKRSEQLVVDIASAAADKDFRENAPLNAAREQKGFIDGRIKEIEDTLRLATVVGCGQGPVKKTGISDTVVLCDVVSGEEVSYIIVHPTEADPVHGKISCESPVGKAVVGRGEGEVVEATVPAGKLRYQIKKVGRG